MKNWIFIKDFYYYKKIDNITFKIKFFNKEEFPEIYYLLKTDKTKIEYYWEDNIFWKEYIIGIIDLLILKKIYDNNDIIKKLEKK